MAREGPVVRYLSDVRRFGSVEVAPDFRGRSDVRTLECVGRPGLVGRPLILARVRDRRSSGPGRSSGGSSGVGRPVPTGRPVAGASSVALLLVPRAWCPRLLVHGLPLGSWSCIAHMFEVVAMSHMWKVMIRRGASSPCGQRLIIEVSS